jgi:hypothetical protein
MRELDWFDGPEDPGETARRRPRGFALLVAGPWLVVVALLVGPQLGRDGAETTAASPPAGSAGEESTVDSAGPSDAVPPSPALPSEAAGVPHADGTTVAPTPATGTRDPLAPPEILEVEELRGRWRVAPGSEEAASLAIVVARAWLTGVGPQLGIEGLRADDTAYAEHLVVEAVERTSAETEVVTVLAVVLREGSEATAAVTVERLAVPIAVDDDGPRPAGAPWPLPGPRLDPVVPTLTPVEDDAGAWDRAVAALARAGLGTYQLEDLQQAPDGPLVATVTDGTDTHAIWLRAHLDGYVVAGSTLSGAPPRRPATEDGR